MFQNQLQHVKEISMSGCGESISNRLWRNLAWVTEKKTEADARLPSPGHCRENNSCLCKPCPGQSQRLIPSCNFWKTCLMALIWEKSYKSDGIFCGWSYDKWICLFSSNTYSLLHAVVQSRKGTNADWLHRLKYEVEVRSSEVLYQVINNLTDLKSYFILVQILMGP